MLLLSLSRAPGRPVVMVCCHLVCSSSFTWYVLAPLRGILPFLVVLGRATKWSQALQATRGGRQLPVQDRRRRPLDGYYYYCYCYCCCYCYCYYYNIYIYIYIERERERERERGYLLLVILMIVISRPGGATKALQARRPALDAAPVAKERLLG